MAREKSEAVQRPGRQRRSVVLMDEPVTLRKRAVPLVRMIEEAHASSEPIVWGV